MKKLLVLDSHSLIHRAYHALPFLKTSKDETVNAVYGFFSILIKNIQDFNPEYIAAVFDFPAATFRHKQFKEYKAKRPPTPNDLISQIIEIKKNLPLLGISVFEKKGFEADDVIGTICNLSKVETIIISGDKDLLQLIDKNTKVSLLKKGIKETFLYDIERIKEDYNLKPKELIDYKSLRGDNSDNIPGVPGIGEKTALELIQRFSSLKNIYQKIDKIDEKTKQKLISFKKQAFLSYQLSLIEKNVPLDFSLNKCSWSGINQEKFSQVFGKFEFHTLIKRISSQNLSLF